VVVRRVVKFAAGYCDLNDFRNREWKPAQLAAGIELLRRIYDLRHTFASSSDLSR
jgi:hypothetical protein